VKPEAIIVDLDGTLCMNEHRRHFMRQVPKDRDSFHGALSQDKVNPNIASLLNLMRDHCDYKIVILTGRPDTYREPTVLWLSANYIEHDDLLMRTAGDCRPDTEVKAEIFKHGIAGYYDVQFALEDKDSVVKMWRELGVECWQVADGSYG
jgi:hypothetical protein